MRPVREITAEEENFRIERRGNFEVIKRDSIEPEPVGTIVLIPFRIEGYDRDCDGSLMARLAGIDCEGEETGWTPRSIGLYHNTDLVVTLTELKSLFASSHEEP